MIFRQFILWGIVLYSQFVASSSHHPVDFLQSIQGKKDMGRQIVNHYCLTCHGGQPSIQVGAPRIKVSRDWVTRLKQPINLLFQHIDEGVGLMPPRGGCFECSDDELIKAIIYLIPISEQKAQSARFEAHKKNR